MRMLPYRNVTYALAFLLIGSQPATASYSSYVGTFTNDNDVWTQEFTLTSSTSVVLKTLSFGGGVNAIGDTISDGGFTPHLTLFEGTGPSATYITRSADPSACGGANPGNADSATGLCWDAYISQILAAGTYTLALTQWENVAVQATLADGFVFDGTDPEQTHFTSPPGGTFWEANVPPTGVQRGNHWAVDIIVSEIPEPATLPLTLGGLAMLGLFIHRRLSTECATA